MHSRVPAPARCDEIHQAVLVEVTGRNAVPATSQTIQTQFRCAVGESTAIIREDSDGSPFQREQEVGVAVCIDIREHRGGDEPHVTQLTRVVVVRDEDASFVSQDVRRCGRGVPRGLDATSHKQVQVAIAIVVCQRQRTRGSHGTGHRFDGTSGGCPGAERLPKIDTQHGRCVSGSLRTLRLVVHLTDQE